MAERSLATEIQYLKGVGPRNAAALAKAGLITVGDVLYHFPRRYEDRSHLPQIGDVRPGQWVTVRGRLIHFDARPTGRGMVILKAIIRDATGKIALTWFNQPWIRTALERHEGEVLAYGCVKETPRGYELASPEWELIGLDDDPDEFARIVPVYRLTEGLGQRVVRKAAASAIEHYIDLAPEGLPVDFRRKHGLQPAAWSLKQIHRPDSEADRLKARKRLVFEEFFLHQISLAFSRAQIQQELGIAFPIDRLLAKSDISTDLAIDQAESVREGEGLFGAAPTIASPSQSVKRKKRTSVTGRSSVEVVPEVPDVPVHLFVEEQRAKYDREPLWEQIQRMLPFELTGAQRRVIQEIWSDMARPYPMNRLVQGDVGSGKTAVAACCMLAAVRSGYQAAMMAPTELLAEQHAANLKRLFDPLGIEVELLVGKLTAGQKRRAAERTANGVTQISVGTHAIIQEGIRFQRLGLVVVDEQHRFGVLQRKALRDKGLGNPDVLVMTATPIPRSLTMAFYGDLDSSVIDELPPGRRPIKTHWKLPFERESVYRGVRKLLEEGKQAYVVCPLVSESEKMLAQAAEELHLQLSSGAFAGLRVGLLHGQLKAKDKDAVMESFRRHELDALVATTVIEVGVDVPNASVMVIEDATRFGLAQLHQLRGRVGRGVTQSFCVMIADAKGEDGRTRMEVLVDTNDGFKIAEADLRLRGPGEIAGTKQSGNLDFRLADLVQDGRMLEEARQAAMEVIAADPKLEGPEWSLVRRLIQEKRSDAAIVTVS